MAAARDLDDDALARRAARLVADGDLPDIGAALRRLNAAPRLEGLARRHLAAMMESMLGQDGVAALRLARLEDALAVMETIEDLEERLADDRWIHRGVVLAGRVATGVFDPEAVVHLRQHGDRPLEDLEPELGLLEAVEIVHRSSRSRFGVLSSLEFEIDGGRFRLRRCPPDQVPLDADDLFDGGPVATIGVPGLRRLVERSRP